MNRKTVFIGVNVGIVIYVIMFFIQSGISGIFYLASNTWFWTIIILAFFVYKEIYSWTKKTYFMDTLRSQKIFFVICLATHVFGYYLDAVIMIVTNGFSWWLFDFYSIFMLGVRTLLTNPANLYSCIPPLYCTQCRRAPSVLLYYMIFYSMPAPLNLLTQSLISLYCNFGSAYVIFQICKLEKIKQMQIPSFIKSPYVIAGIFLIFEVFFDEYLLGSCYSLAAFFVIAGIFYFLKDKEHLGFFLWSISVTFMPNQIVWILFFIIKRPFRKFVKNVCYTIIPLLPSISIFLLWPKLITDFIPCNFGFIRQPIAGVGISGSLSSNLRDFFNINIGYTMLISTIVIAPITFLIINRLSLHFIDKLMLVALSTSQIIPDFNAGHVLYFMVPYLFWLSMKSQDISIKIKMIPFIPTTIMIIWIIFPFMSLFYIIPLIIVDYIFLKKMVQERARKPSPEIMNS